MRIDFATRNGFRAGWSGLCLEPRHFSPDRRRRLNRDHFFGATHHTPHRGSARPSRLFTNQCGRPSPRLRAGPWQQIPLFSLF